MTLKALLTTLVVFTFAFSLNAAESTVLDSRISEVTVFADRAEVVREATLDLDAGTHSLLFANLPSNVDQNSLQVDGTGGFTLQDVRFETRQLTHLPEGKLKELTDELEKYSTQAKALGMTTTRLKDQRAAVDAILKRETTPPTESSGSVVNAGQWNELLSFYNTQLEKLDQATLENEATLKEVREEQARLKREIDQLNSRARKVSNTAKVVVALGKPSTITINLTSIVYGPSWTPSYDIRANTTGKQVTIASYGSITQNTGEDWNDVQLNLSTAQPQVSGREPTLHPWFIQENQNRLTPSNTSFFGARAKGALANNMMSQLMEVDGVEFEASPPAEAMAVLQASVQSGATAVVYQIPTSASIQSNNQPVRVSITEQTFPGHFRYSAVPKLSPHVYLKTKVTNTSEYAFLPGPSNIYLDGSFVGKAPVDLVPPGKEFWTWLGIDQGVTVERKIVDRKEGDVGLFGGKKSVTYRYEFEIKNNKQDAIELVVWDQLPISQNDDIKVELEKPKYTEDTDTFKMNAQKYVEWLYQLKPGQEVKTPYEFTVTYPKDMQVWGL